MKRTLCLLTALAFLLSCPAMAGAAKKEADPVPTCASCGQESAGQPFCPYCGAEETDNAGQHRPGSPRPGGVPAGSVTPGDAQAVADRYGISLKDGVPLYTPSDPQPLCAYIVLDSRCEAGLTQGGIQAVTSGTMPGELLNAVQACARKIHEYSEGMVRFVQDPDQADILISVLQSYSFKGDYASSGGGKAKGYSCKLTLTAYQLTYPAYTVSVSETNTPADSVRLSGGGTFWMDTPELYKNAQLPSFSETILYWYGYKKDRAIGPKDRHDLTRLMETLAARGYYSGKLSGFKDTDVTEAIRALQTGSGIIPTGKTTDLFTLSAVYFDDRTTEPFRDSYLRERVMDAGRTEQVCPGCSYLYRRDLGYGFCPHCGAKLPEYPSEGVRPAADQASPGDILTFGRYEQDGNLLNGLEPIEWVVLEEKDDLLLVISRYVLLGHQYKGQYSSVNGKTLFVSAWLNDQFRSAAFTRREQARIQYTKLPEQKTNGVYIFSLSDEEAAALFASDQDRACLPTAYARQTGLSVREGETCSWWLRTPASDGSRTTGVGPGGGISSAGFPNEDISIGVRPAMWIRRTVPDPELPETPAPVPLEEASAKDIVLFGRYEQNNTPSDGPEPIEWIVLERKGGKMLLLSLKALDYAYYDGSTEGTVWETCHARAWLNETFLHKAFFEEERKMIPETKLKNPKNSQYGTKGGKDTKDRVFLLSADELKQDLPGSVYLKCVPTETAIENGVKWSRDSGLCSWWLRTPGEGKSQVMYVDWNGKADYKGTHISQDCAIRPAIWIDLG